MVAPWTQTPRFRGHHILECSRLGTARTSERTFLSRRGTRSNPFPSSGESIANPTFSIRTNPVFGLVAVDCHLALALEGSRGRVRHWRRYRGPPSDSVAGLGRRLFRSVVCRRDQGLDWQLRRRIIRVGVPLRRLRCGLCAVFGYSQSRPNTGGGVGGGRLMCHPPFGRRLPAVLSRGPRLVNPSEP